MKQATGMSIVQPEDEVDPKAELQRFIRDCTCERCRMVCASPQSLFPVWHCMITKQAGYQRRHSKVWRLCGCCAAWVAIKDDPSLNFSPAEESLGKLAAAWNTIVKPSFGQPMVSREEGWVEGRRENDVMVWLSNFRTRIVYQVLDEGFRPVGQCQRHVHID